jgi:hypothetical protein
MSPNCGLKRPIVHNLDNTRIETQWNDYDRGKWTQRNPVTMPLCPPQNPHGLIGEQTRNNIMTGQSIYVDCIINAISYSETSKMCCLKPVLTTAKSNDTNIYTINKEIHFYKLQSLKKTKNRSWNLYVSVMWILQQCCVRCNHQTVLMSTTECYLFLWFLSVRDNFSLNDLLLV